MSNHQMYLQKLLKDQLAKLQCEAITASRQKGV